MGFLFKINAKDNVAVAIGDIEAGQQLEVNGQVIIPTQHIQQGHKVALVEIKANDNVIKYGNPIGHAIKDIAIGEWVHTYNLKTNLSETLKYTYKPIEIDTVKQTSKTFLGYKRPDGKVGIRNEIWIIPTVGCVNGIAKQVESLAQNLNSDGIDGVYAFTHPFGCSQLGEDHENTQKILAGLVNHPNAAGVLVLGLGCENNLISEFKKVLGDTDDNRVKFLEAQSSDNEIDESLQIIKELIRYGQTFKREETAVSELIVGLKCGGSDGYSGITANPMVGVFSDMLVAQGGTTILTEVPEMFGAETLLMERCENETIFKQCVNMINGFKDYFLRHGQVVYENPSPGNKKGGISTLEDKSLGCTQKSGNATVVDILDYGEITSKKGLNLLTAPGNDLVASTALIATGAQIVLFTTGRGTPFGAPAPTVKISTNTNLYNKKSNWIDFNAGTIVEGQGMTDCANELFDYVIKLASGEIKTKTEINGYREISIFKDGVFL